EREEDIAEVGAALGRTPEQIRAIVSHLHESNPMLGHRGCRLGITRPEIYQMQTRAIFDATLALVAEGLNPQPQIMIPLVSTASELEYLRSMIDGVRNEYEDADGALHRIKIGTMLEL